MGLYNHQEWNNQTGLYNIIIIEHVHAHAGSWHFVRSKWFHMINTYKYFNQFARFTYFSE